MNYLFRGKRIDNGEWIEGSLINEPDQVSILIDGHMVMDTSSSRTFIKEVDPSTVGMWTGLKDKHGKKAFQGDIFKYMGELFELASHQEWFCWYGEPIDHNAGFASAINMNGSMEIVGTIHDNN